MWQDRLRQLAEGGPESVNDVIYSFVESILRSDSSSRLEISPSYLESSPESKSRANKLFEIILPESNVSIDSTKEEVGKLAEYVGKEDYSLHSKEVDVKVTFTFGSEPLADNIIFEYGTPEEKG